MNASEFSGDLFQEVFDAGVFSNVANLGQRPAAERLDFGGGGLHEFGAPASRNNVGARFGQRFGDCEPDAAGPANDDCIFVCKIEKWMAHKGDDKVRGNYTVMLEWPTVASCVSGPAFFRRYKISPAWGMSLIPSDSRSFQSSTLTVR